jgi:TP901-1 family phage major tail protein
MATFNGTDLGVYIDGTLIAGSTDCSLSMSTEVIDISTKDSSAYRGILPGMRSATVTCSGLVDYTHATLKDVPDLFDLFDGRTQVTLKFSNEATGDESYTAQAFLTSLEQSAGVEDTATYSATFEITGAITAATIS